MLLEGGQRVANGTLDLHRHILQRRLAALHFVLDARLNQTRDVARHPLHIRQLNKRETRQIRTRRHKSSINGRYATQHTRHVQTLKQLQLINGHVKLIDIKWEKTTQLNTKHSPNSQRKSHQKCPEKEEGKAEEEQEQDIIHLIKRHAC